MWRSIPLRHVLQQSDHNGELSPCPSCRTTVTQSRLLCSDLSHDKKLLLMVISSRLRMVIHFPLSIHPDNPFPNLTVVARAACLILDTYTQISHSILFIPKWSETRRIITATQLLIVCWVRGEMDKTEMKRYAERGVCLLYRASGGFEPAEKVLRDMIKLLEAAGLEKSEVVGWTKQGEIEGEDVRIGVGQSRGGEGVIPPFDFTLPS